MENVTDERSANRAAAPAYPNSHAIGRCGTTTNQKQQKPEQMFSIAPFAGSQMSQSDREHAEHVQHDGVEAREVPKDEETVLYLAYGSNLAASTFEGARGIRPLSQVNVQVPSLRLTFDLPGIPYLEPCFANTARRDPNADWSQADGIAGEDEKTPLRPDGSATEDDKEDRWDKGLIGVVYEVTRKDYEHIIATEGGGASYQDVLVDCYPFATANPHDPVPQKPTLPPFQAHTLLAPADGGSPEDGGRPQRPRPGYAQASARYLKLITDGAAESKLPYEYQDYLLSLRPYRITTVRQRLGQALLAATWGPLLFLFFALGRILVDDNGRLPGWMVKLSGMLFQALWKSYDTVYKPVFGDGERTIRQDVRQRRHHSLRHRHSHAYLEKMPVF